MESIAAADVAAAQRHLTQTDKEMVKHLQGQPTASLSSLGSAATGSLSSLGSAATGSLSSLGSAATGSLSSLGSAASRKSSLTSGYRSDTPYYLDGQSSHHSQSSVEDEESATRRHTCGTGKNKSFSTSSCPLDSLPRSRQKKRQCWSRSKLPSLLESPSQTTSSRRRKIAVHQMSLVMPPPPPVINKSLISDGSVHTFTHHHDPRLQVTDLVLSASEDEGGEDSVESEQYNSWRMHFGYPFIDEAVSESDCDNDSIHSSRSNSHSSFLYQT